MSGRQAAVAVVVGATLALIAIVALGAAPEIDGGGDGERPQVLSNTSGLPPRSTADHLACTRAEEPANFGLYSLGSSFEDLPLTAVIRTCNRPLPVAGDDRRRSRTWRANSVSYVYGTCEPPPGGEGGCAPPLEIRVSPACEVDASRYRRRPGPTRRRGVPSAERDRNGIELYSGDSTVAVLSLDRDRAFVERAVEALQPMPPGRPPAKLPPIVTPVDSLFAPVEGAIDGELRCDQARTPWPGG